MKTHARWHAAVGAISAVVLTACGAQASAVPHAAGTSPSARASSAQEGPRIALPVSKGASVEGLVDVHGHDIYARCSGTGSPTVVYFTGWAPDLSKRGVEIAKGIEAVDRDHHRICSYERRNTGRSEAVPGTQAPEDALADVDGVLAALGEKGPFVLLGASFGGLVAAAYAVAHPERVAGVLLLDSSIPDDYIIDKLHGFQGVCLPANRQADAWQSLEKIDNCRLAKWAYDRRAREPHVPLIYLAAKDPSDRGDIADDPLRKAYVRTWSPGIWTPVNAPHWMDEADRKLVLRSLARVIALANRGAHHQG